MQIKADAVMEELPKHPGGWVLDGFPTTQSEAEVLLQAGVAAQKVSFRTLRDPLLFSLYPVSPS